MGWKFVSASNREELINDGVYMYDWPRRRMLVTNSRCPGGPKGRERRDLACDGVFTDGRLYARGKEGGAPFCCVWHEAPFYPTPPDFRSSAVLVDSDASIGDVPAHHYVQQAGGGVYGADGHGTHDFFTRRDTGLPLAHITGFGAMYMYSKLVEKHPIPSDAFDVPSECDRACNWANLSSPADGPPPVTSCERLGKALHFKTRSGAANGNPHCPASWNQLQH